MKEDLSVYSVESFSQVGAGVCQAICDITRTGQSSRLAASAFQRLEYLRLYVALKTVPLAPFRFDPQLRQLLKGLFEKKEMFLGCVKQLRHLLEPGLDKKKTKKTQG